MSLIAYVTALYMITVELILLEKHVQTNFHRLSHTNQHVIFHETDYVDAILPTVLQRSPPWSCRVFLRCRWMKRIPNDVHFADDLEDIVA